MADKQHEDDDALGATPPAPAGEGVRIIGADEAQSVVASGKAAERIPVDEPRLGDVPEAPVAPRSPTVSFPTPGGAPIGGTLFEEPGEGRARAAASAEEPTAAIPLPHWSEPPTGEVSIVFEGDDLEPIDAAESVSALRFRTDAGSWDDEETSLHEALVLEEDHAEELDVDSAAPLTAAAVESDDDFDAAVKARRGRRSAATPTVKNRRRRGPAALPGTPQVPAPTAPAPTPAPTPGAAMPGLPPQPQVPANLVLRIGVGVAIAVVCIVFFLIGTAATVALVSLVTAVAAVEIYSGLRKQHAHPAALLGIIACTAMPVAAYNIGERAFPVVLVLLVAFSMLWFLFGVSKTRPVIGVAMTVLGFAYVGVFAGFAGLLLAMPNGIGALIGVAACAIAYDVGGYLVGSMMGKTRITPHISPNKTLEGLVAGMAAAVLVGALIGIFQVAPWGGFLGGVGLGFVCAIIAPLGDLCESMIKRDIGIKDFGDLLPGHGGILDRFDTILFCMPAAFYLLWYIVM